MKRVLALLALAAIALVGVLCLGGAPYSPLRVLDVLTGGGDQLDRYSILTLRAPRALLTALVGAALAQSGLLLQGVTRNPLADPGLLGVTAGAGLAVTALMASYPNNAAAPVWLLPITAFAGGIAAVTALLALSGTLRHGQPTRLLVIGIALGASAGALSQVLALTIREDLLAAVVAWQVGTLQGAGWPSLWVVAPALACATLCGLLLAPRLDLLALGDEAATGLGAEPGPTRVWAILLAALLAAVCVAVAGGLGFVGLFAPHIARGVVGARHGLLLPATAAVGAVTTCGADLVAHHLVPGMVLPMGSVIAVIGVPWLLISLARMSRT